MQPLRLNQKFLTLVSLCAPPDDASGAEVFFYGVVGLYVFVTLCSDFVSSSLFLIQWKTHVLEEVLGSVLQTAAVSGNICGMVSLFVLSKRFKGVFSLYQQIYDSSGHDKLGILAKTEALCVRITRILVIKYVTGYLVISVTLATLNVTACYFTEGEIHTECLFTPYKHILPWNDEEFIGWFYGLLCSFWMSGTYFFMNGIFLSFFLSVGFNFDAFQRQFDVILSEISEQNSFERNFNQHAKEVMQHAVEFHCLVKKLFMELRVVYAGVLFGQLICGTMFMTGALFQIDIAMHHPDTYFYAYLNSFILATSNLYLYCYSGATSTLNCLKYSNTVFQTDWYAMPLDLQKYLIFMIRSGNQPLIFSGYGIIKLDLESFTKVLKSVISYYLMFKALTE